MGTLRVEDIDGETVYTKSYGRGRATIIKVWSGDKSCKVYQSGLKWSLLTEANLSSHATMDAALDAAINHVSI